MSAVGVIVAWATLGPVFDFSNTWQLVVNTTTSIITFLMVFVIHSSQNRVSEAIQIKLDELIRAIEGADDTLMDLEELEEAELDAIRAKYQQMAERARAAFRRRP